MRTAREPAAARLLAPAGFRMPERSNCDLPQAPMDGGDDPLAARARTTQTSSDHFVLQPIDQVLPRQGRLTCSTFYSWNFSGDRSLEPRCSQPQDPNGALPAPRLPFFGHQRPEVGHHALPPKRYPDWRLLPSNFLDFRYGRERNATQRVIPDRSGQLEISQSRVHGRRILARRERESACPAPISSNSHPSAARIAPTAGRMAR